VCFVSSLVTLYTELPRLHQKNMHKVAMQSLRPSVRSTIEGQLTNFVLIHRNQSRIKFGRIPYTAVGIVSLSFQPIFSLALSLLGQYFFWGGGEGGDGRWKGVGFPVM
jgi:hypothetical protein